MNSDAILIMGSSMAENHPVGFQWVMEARERGAKVIHVDPRFTRTSAMADIWACLRAGTDIVFLGAVINYVLKEGRDFREYVTHFTNASVILREDFRDTEELDGLFSGWNAKGADTILKRGSTKVPGQNRRAGRHPGLCRRAADMERTAAARRANSGPSNKT